MKITAHGEPVEPSFDKLRTSGVGGYDSIFAG